MQTDRPIQTADQDRFDRVQFARRVAEIIRHRRDPATLIVGIYGPWGDGKSSTLELIKEALGATEDVVTVDYNPWFFSSSTENLAAGLFLSLGEAIKKTGTFSKENIGNLLKKYGGLVPKFGGTLKSLGQTLSITDLKSTRSKVEAILKRYKTPIVVFVDDIDRLDREEIQTLFKLVRLAADFPYVTYVLAFDDEVVSAALGEAYEGGDKSAGRRFIEKIIQVPLHLPRPKSETLRGITFDAVSKVLSENEIEIDESEKYRFAVTCSPICPRL